MSKVKFELNRAGVREILQSQEIIDVLEGYADEVIRKCDGNYETSAMVGRNRANVSVMTSDSDTYYKNLNDNEVLKALW